MRQQGRVMSAHAMRKIICLVPCSILAHWRVHTSTWHLVLRINIRTDRLPLVDKYKHACIHIHIYKVHVHSIIEWNTMDEESNKSNKSEWGNIFLMHIHFPIYLKWYYPRFHLTWWHFRFQGTYNILAICYLFLYMKHSNQYLYHSHGHF